MNGQRNNPAPPTGSNLHVTFTDLAYGGDAVGKDPGSGLTVFAWPGITGETATVSVTGGRNNLLRGVVSQVEGPSPLRIAPPCPYFGPCGGCQWQHISYPGQVQFKHDILRSQLTRIGGIADPDAILKPPTGSPRDFGYRNSSHFAIDPASRSLAYFKRESHSLIPVDHCPISNEGINRAIPMVNSLLVDTLLSSGFTEEPRKMMQVWKVAIRSSEATGQTLVVFHTRAGGQAQPRPGKQRAPRHHDRSHARPDEGPNMESAPEANPVVPVRRRDVKRAVAALTANLQDGETLALTVVEVMDDGTINALGQSRAAGSFMSESVADAMTGSLLSMRGRSQGEARMAPTLGSWVERLAGRNYWVAPEAFFQVNTQAAELLLEEVGAWVPEDVGLLLDAHAGVGTFALALAARARKVIGFEMDGATVTSATWTAAAHSATNLEFRQGRAEVLAGRLAAQEQPDLVLLDPPRAGCHPDLLSAIISRQVPRVIYVSCDPSTLARDVKFLSSNYQLTSARMIDMFPQTYHLETVAVLDRK
ncbi:MAG TPA: hypothetical protein VGE45_11110 [Chloroflexia bacterium]